MKGVNILEDSSGRVFDCLENIENLDIRCVSGVVLDKGDLLTALVFMVTIESILRMGERNSKWLKKDKRGRAVEERSWVRVENRVVELFSRHEGLHRVTRRYPFEEGTMHQGGDGI